jgi:choline kinase
VSAQAVILGAGRGVRLGQGNPGVPKPLIEVGGQTIIDRQLGKLDDVFPDRVRTIVVAGFRTELMEAATSGRAEIVQNDDYETTNTAASLFLALQAFPDETVLLNGDVVLEQAALDIIGPGTGAAVEFKAEVDPEEVQVILDGDGETVTRIGKDIGGQGEAVGIYRMTPDFIASYLAEFDAERDQRNYYEDVFNRIIARGAAFAAWDLQDALAMEIDTLADLERVEQRLAAVS